MSGKLITIREWLERNKIFFEIVVALSLTCMSIIVSINANQIAAYQNELIKGENQPVFVFNLTFAENDRLGKAERIDISNIGKPAYNFNAEPYIFFDVHLYNKSNYNEKTAYVPVTNYYGYSIKTGYPTDLLVSFNKYYSFPIKGTNSTGNYAVFYHINEDFRNYSQEQNYFGYIELRRYFHITYSDIYRENHDEIYFVSEATSFRVTGEEKIRLGKRYDDGYIPNYGFSEFKYLSPIELINILSSDSKGNEYGENRSNI